jgi:hypothetical protein
MEMAVYCHDAVAKPELAAGVSARSQSTTSLHDFIANFEA